MVFEPTFGRIVRKWQFRGTRASGLGASRCVFLPSPSDLDPPKSPLKRGTLTEFSPLKKGGMGGSWGLKTDPRVPTTKVVASLIRMHFAKETKGRSL